VTSFQTDNPLLSSDSLTPGDKITGDVVLELDLVTVHTLR